MDAIFASKLYKSSKHQEKIKSALKDPVNSELVMQLRSYLDDEYTQPKASESENTQSTETRSEVETESAEIREPSSKPTRSKPLGKSSNEYDLTEMLDEGTEDKDLPEGGVVSDPEADRDAEDVEESTSVNSQPIVATIDINDIALQRDSIKGLLNSRDDTAGVARINIKDDELWIHYNDAINLNNVMEPVISVLNETDYNTLQFNRLARTENAIVFTITEVPQPKVGTEVNE